MLLILHLFILVPIVTVTKWSLHHLAIGGLVYVWTCFIYGATNHLVNCILNQPLLLTPVQIKSATTLNHLLSSRIKGQLHQILNTQSDFPIFLPN